GPFAGCDRLPDEAGGSRARRERVEEVPQGPSHPGSLSELVPVSSALAFLGVQPAERRSALLMIAHSFCMGCATVFFETAASALFLSSFEKEMLPWVYVAAAAVNIMTGAVYAKL